MQAHHQLLLIKTSRALLWPARLQNIYKAPCCLHAANQSCIVFMDLCQTTDKRDINITQIDASTQNIVTNIETNTYKSSYVFVWKVLKSTTTRQFELLMQIANKLSWVSILYFPNRISSDKQLILLVIKLFHKATVPGGNLLLMALLSSMHQDQLPPCKHIQHLQNFEAAILGLVFCQWKLCNGKWEWRDLLWKLHETFKRSIQYDAKAANTLAQDPLFRFQQKYLGEVENECLFSNTCPNRTIGMAIDSLIFA